MEESKVGGAGPQRKRGEGWEHGAVCRDQATCPPLQRPELAQMRPQQTEEKPLSTGQRTLQARRQGPEPGIRRRRSVLLCL